MTDAAMLPGLDGTKMSTSRGNGIALSMTADETAARIRRARTDAQRRITFDPVGRPEIASMLTMIGLFTDREPGQIADEIGDGGAASLKRLLTDVVNDGLAAHRRRRAALIAEPGHLRSVLQDGNSRANAIADATLRDVREAMGMTY